METAEIHCIVSGKVQGVTYRDFVAKHARHLALVGYVCNLQDFRVEIVAQGPRADLEKFLEYARRGPIFAQVSNIDIEWREPQTEYLSFQVVF
ncbi:MAG: acylphosphatase [Patescibacteria group bacterium]